MRLPFQVVRMNSLEFMLPLFIIIVIDVDNMT